MYFIDPHPLHTRPACWGDNRNNGIEPYFCVAMAHSLVGTRVACCVPLRNFVGALHGKSGFMMQKVRLALFLFITVIIIVLLLFYHPKAIRGLLRMYPEHQPNSRRFHQMANWMRKRDCEMQLSLPFSHVVDIWGIRVLATFGFPWLSRLWSAVHGEGKDAQSCSKNCRLPPWAIYIWPDVPLVKMRWNKTSGDE